MEYRILGRTGLRVSSVGLGCGNIGGLFVRGEPGDQRRAVERAVECGVNYFDTAPLYGDGRSEENLGRVLADLRLSDVYVGTKVTLQRDDLGVAAAKVRESLEVSLRRLRRDAVDLLQLHSRVTLSPIDLPRSITSGDLSGRIAEALGAVKAAGLARFVGLTGLGETEALHEAVASGRFDTIQCYFNVLNPSAGHAREAARGDDRSEAGQDFAGLIDRASEAGLGVIAIRVLAAGAVSGVGQRHPLAGDPGTPLAGGAVYDADVRRAGRLSSLASELGLESPVELALRFVLAKGAISTALVGVSDLPQLECALGWAERGPLDPDAVQRVLG